MWWHEMLMTFSVLQENTVYDFLLPNSIYHFGFYHQIHQGDSGLGALGETRWSDGVVLKLESSDGKKGLLLPYTGNTLMFFLSYLETFDVGKYTGYQGIQSLERPIFSCKVTGSKEIALFMNGIWVSLWARIWIS